MDTLLIQSRLNSLDIMKRHDTKHITVFINYRYSPEGVAEKHINGLQIELVECILVLLFQFFYVLYIKECHYNCIME